MTYDLSPIEVLSCRNRITPYKTGCTVNIVRFLSEVNSRARNAIPPEIDPIGIILTRVGLYPHTLESRALSKATLATIARKGEMSDSDLWALGQEALALLDTFADCLEHGRYRPQDLEAYAARLAGR